MTARAITTLVGLAFVLTQLPANAHHSFAATYDTDRIAHLEGRVVAVRWINPHVSLTFDAADTSQKGAIDGPRSKSGDLRIGGTMITFTSTGRVFSTPTTNSFRERVAAGL